MAAFHVADTQITKFSQTLLIVSGNLLVDVFFVVQKLKNNSD